GDDREFSAWQRFYGMTAEVARRVFPTLTEPLPTRAELRARVADEAAWRALFEEPIGVAVEENFRDDLVRGVVLTDALIGTFADAHDPSLAQNRCFLYHVIGGGTGAWDVPVGGMGALTDALAGAARAAGAEIATGHEAVRIDTDGRTAEVTYRTADGEGVAAARHVLVNASPRELATLTGDIAPDPAEGAQLKVNMLLKRLPRLKDSSVDPREAFAGTFHIAEGYQQLATAHAQAAAGELPAAPPSEIYCHSLTDPTILGPDLAARGYQTLTLFGLHTPARLFAQDNDAVREELLKSTLAQLDAHLAEPLTDCLATDADGRPCIEARTPLDLDRDLGLPGGNIFHRALTWPHAQDGTGRWGVETRHANVLLCGAGAVRGGGVSGVPGHNAAMAVLGE
ncbi:FAD-dependent oxidoreductase, partial [Streptomyces sp. SID4982]|uniref:phytoene desaturase family protein n=1 Tax=Streptomyces sp. SID4982 TaxID=2690291 RepID=UPI001369804B